jgi:hypothetical protein
MVERKAYSSIVNIDSVPTDSRDMMQEFYKKTPPSSWDAAGSQTWLESLDAATQGLPLTQFGAEGIQLRYYINLLRNHSQTLRAAETEEKAATGLRYEFGAADQNAKGYDLVLPVYLKLWGNQLTSQEILRQVAINTEQVISEISRLMGIILLAVEQQQQAQAQELQQYEQAQAQLDALDTQGHVVVQKEKDEGSDRIQRHTSKLNRQQAQLKIAERQFETQNSGALSLATLAFTLAQTETGSTELRQTV